jgi:general secretion pathway protein D
MTETVSSPRNYCGGVSYLILTSILAVSAASPANSQVDLAQKKVNSSPETASYQQGALQKDDNDNTQPLPNMHVFEGSGTFVNPAASKMGGAKKGDVTLDFVDVDVRDVVRAVFGEILQQSYVIDPKISGRMTLKTGRPIAKEAVIPSLEAALKMLGAGISRNADIYNIAPLSDTATRGQVAFDPNEALASGYGIEIVPLEYVSAEEMQRVITPLVPDKTIVQIDPKRNLIFLAGSETQRSAVRETIARFDVNYLKGMSFALVQPTHANADTLAGELDKIFGEANSPIAGLVRLVPIARINSILVITSRQAYLKEVQRWVGRLDIAPVTPDRKLYFYRLQNARAKDIAEALGRVFGINTGAASSSELATTSANRGTQDLRTQRSNITRANQTEASAPGLVQNGQRGGFENGVTNKLDTPQVVTDEANNALIIRADAADFAAIDDVIKQMDVAPSQVMVEATIVEVTLNDTLKYGVEWYFQNSKETYTMSQNGSIATSFPGLGVTYTAIDIKAALNTLGSLTNVSVLSSPKILTLDNKSATIEVGDQIPIITQTSVSTTSSDSPVVSSIEQRDTGVILSVTPRVGNSGIVYLDISQEVSSSSETTSSNIDSPTIQQRKLKTTVAVYDGATVALGGLIQHSETKSDSGIPYLKDIPLLGAAFSTKSGIRTRTELLVFLTPHVIRNLPSALNVTEKLKQDMQDIREALDDLPKHPNPRRPW